MRARSLALLALAACGGSPAPPSATPAANAPVAPAPAASRSLTPAEIAQRAMPAIVTIRTEHSLGTGFILSPDGWIATNLHVIVGGAHVKVTLRGERVFEVTEVLSASTDHDLVLLKIDAQGLPVLALGDSDAMRPGDPVVAIGNPMGLEDTVSNGLVSARRTITRDIEVLQISAPIATGSSGGPIFNDRGEVIGIATAIMLQGQNLNFGMPTRYLLPMLKDPKPLPFAEFAKIVARSQEAAAARMHRNHPVLAASTLDGCTVDTQKLIAHTLERAIETGAPLFNAGNHDGCYHVYDGTASDVLRKLPKTCEGPARVLVEAQRRAASLPDPSSQAWAMRDAFDAVLDVITAQQQPPAP